MRQLEENTIIEVLNMDVGGAGYVTDKVVRTFHRTGESKKVKFEELREAMNKPGGRVLFERGTMLIKSPEAREELGLEPLSDYLLDKNEMIELLKSNDLEKIEDFLQYCPSASLSTFAKTAIELPIENIAIANLIKGYSGFEVLEIIQENKRAGKTEISGANQEKGRPRRIIKSE